MSEQSIYNKNLEHVLDKLVKEAHLCQYPLDVASKTVVAFNNVEFQDIEDQEDHALSKFLLKICSLVCVPLDPKNTEWKILPVTTSIGSTLIKKYRLVFTYPSSVKHVAFSKIHLIKSVSPFFIEDIFITSDGARFSIEVLYRSSKCFPNISPQMITLITSQDNVQTHINYSQASVDEHLKGVLGDTDSSEKSGEGNGWFGFLKGSKKRKLNDRDN